MTIYVKICKIFKLEVSYNMRGDLKMKERNSSKDETVKSEKEKKDNIKDTTVKSEKDNIIKDILMSSKFETAIKLAPLMFIVAILPLIVGYVSFEVDFYTYDWFPDQHTSSDLYLYNKQICFNVIVIFCFKYPSTI